MRRATIEERAGEEEQIQVCGSGPVAVRDITAVEPELLRALAMQARIAQEEVLFTWASVPCKQLVG